MAGENDQSLPVASVTVRSEVVIQLLLMHY